jgi:hypothetical protein
MSRNDTIFCIGPVKCPTAASFRHSALFLFSVLLTGCSTVVTYQPHLPDGPAKPAGYPIPVYTEKMTVPRPCAVIGTVTVAEGSFTMRGGSVEDETKKIIKTAWAKGADVVRIRSVETPGYSRADFRIVADLLRYADQWETLTLSRQDLVNYLDTHRQTLDPIEGIWDGAGTSPNRIGIIQNHSKPGRDFVGFILNTDDPTWHEGDKKIDIQRGAVPGSYVLVYYLEDFSKAKATVILGQRRLFTLNMPTSDEDADFLTYSKIQ